MLCRVSLYFPLVEYHAGARALYSCSLIKSIWLSWLLFESSISCPVQWPPVLHPVGTWMEKEHTVFFLKPLSPLLLVSPDLRLSWSRRDLTEKDSKIFLKKKKLKSWCRYSSVCPPCNRSSVLELLTHLWVFTKPCARGHSKSQLPEAEKVLWLASLSLLLNESLPAGVASPSERAGLLGTNEA